VLYAGAGLLGWTAGSMIAHDKIIGSMITSAVGDWAAIAIQVILAAGVILIGFAMSRRAKSQTA
jgi:predicted tellurium resistance membrane protein TerC